MREHSDSVHALSSSGVGTESAAGSNGTEPRDDGVGKVTAAREKNTLHLDASSSEDIERAAAIIRSGGLVAFPTETVYGLGASALDSAAAERIYAAKGRPSDNPLIIHLARPEDAEKYAVTNELYYELARRFMPGPITVILPKRDIIPSSVTGGLDTVAVRVPLNIFANRLINAAGVPIAAPSANISGRPSATCAKYCLQDFDGRIDAVLDGGDSAFGLESTIVKLCDGGLRLLRPGAVTPEELGSIGVTVTVDPSVTERFDGIPEAPGMKYRHYAPRAEVIIVDGGDREVYDYLRDKKDCGILCFSEDEPLLRLKGAVSLGPRSDPLAQAHALFRLLREFDGRDGIDTIYARMPGRDGAGLAVFNRLIKAAGYRVLRLPPIDTKVNN